MKKLIFLFILSTAGLYAQEAQLKKADKYFATASYTESAEMYSNIIKEGNSDQQVLKKAADSYYFISDFAKAEPIYKKLVTTYKEGLDDKYYFRYAQTLKALNKTSESEKWMKLYQKDIPETVYKASLEKLENIKKEGDKFEIKNIVTNTSFSDFGPAFYQNSLVFSSPSKDNPLAKTYKWTNQPYLDLYIVPIENNEVTNNALPFSPTLNSNLHESDVTFSKDGKTIYFTRNISVNGKRKKDKNKNTNLGIYKAELINDVWTNVQPLSINSTTYSTGNPSLNPENNRLYFESDMPGTIGSADIFYVTIDENGQLGKPVNLGPEINTRTREGFPFIAENNVLYFASDGHAGFGLLDVFKSELKDSTFTTPLNVGLPVNTNADDFSFIVDEKNKKGFFASNRANGKGDDDIYSFSQIIPVELKEYMVQGLIQDSENDILIKDAVITLYDENGNKIKEMIVNETGSFGFDLEKLGTFKITATHPNYIPAEKTFTILDDGKGKHEQNIKMQRIPKTFLEELIAEQGQPKVLTDNGVLMFDLPGILFDYDRSNIRPDAQLQLNKLIDKLNRYPQIKIEIGAHTDIRGRDEYNQKLSQDRASSTKTYLVSKGISADRITGIGYGENKPKVNCSDHECTEAEHQINRRSEFLILVK
ncbi:OmpA family protein [Flavobacterium sp. GT3R68]|uniref:OmpA family protein n=1 Tax=Flavobacterium sp. GT3R68 TaxID=2594437 RepID=UPI000F885481|nr:OmpA family protein [Flavobacterium sp. GT3R68]RTY95351.1 flagellar motor protein MotB [Flavobacterium sp. GSN2]TRW90909.1 OmpA family protein [Flavobacterium sp. GT3R68]